MMYRRERSVPLRGSSLALYNNLAVLPLPAKRLSYFASVHGASVGLVSAAADGAGCAHRQLQAREGGLGPPIITQAAWCALPSRTLLVLASWKGIQMYEPDGSAMVYWHALDGMEASAGMLLFARGIAGTGLHFVCVGTSTGSVLVFDVPAKGTNITLNEVLEQHSSPITDIGAELCEQPEGAADLVTADDSGALCVWGSGQTFRLITKIPASDCTCSSVKLWNGVIAAGYGNGQIRLYEAVHGTLRAQVSAHARWIYALDLAPLSGKVEVTTITTCLLRLAQPGAPQALSWKDRLLWEGSPTQGCKARDSASPVEGLGFFCVFLLPSCCLPPRTPLCGSGG